jgi:hypothetical protein
VVYQLKNGLAFHYELSNRRNLIGSATSATYQIPLVTVDGQNAGEPRYGRFPKIVQTRFASLGRLIFGGIWHSRSRFRQI